MNRIALCALVPLMFASPALAQHAGHSTAQPAAKPTVAAQPKAPPKKSQPKPEASGAASEHAGHDMSDQKAPSDAQADPHVGHDMSAMKSGDAAMDAVTPPTTPPPPAADHLADRYFDVAQMAEARHMLQMEHGGMAFSNVMLDRIEFAPGDSERGYTWNGEFRYGGDIHRLAVKSEGEGSRDKGVEDAEIQVLYSRAVTRYFDVQAGIRQDFKPHSRTYLTVGTEGMFPYWFEVDGAVFLSNEGEVLARAEGTYDLRLTQRLILQPAAEMTLSGQNIPDLEIGSGLSSIELGLRLRYELRREFAPYIGVSYQRKFGDTADYARAAGNDPETAKFVIGIRAWF